MGTNSDGTFHLMLVLKPFGEAAEKLVRRRPAWEQDRQYLVGADAYYDPSGDRGIITLRFRGELFLTLGPIGIAALVESIGLPVVSPSELVTSERKALANELATYPIYVQLFTSTNDDEKPVLERIIAAVAEHAETQRRLATEQEASRERAARLRTELSGPPLGVLEEWEEEMTTSRNLLDVSDLPPVRSYPRRLTTDHGL